MPVNDSDVQSFIASLEAFVRKITIRRGAIITMHTPEMVPLAVPYQLKYLVPVTIEGKTDALLASFFDLRNCMTPSLDKETAVTLVFDIREDA